MESAFIVLGRKAKTLSPFRRKRRVKRSVNYRSTRMDGLSLKGVKKASASRRGSWIQIGLALV